MLQVHPIPAFADNYIWAIRCPAQPGFVVVVDPGDAAPVERYLVDAGKELITTVCTQAFQGLFPQYPELLNNLVELGVGESWAAKP